MDPACSQLVNEVREKRKDINPTALLKREFVTVGSSDKDQANITSSTEGGECKEADVVRVMQWNLLAQGLCQSSDGFILCPPAALEWKCRQYHILEEILTYSVDIFCLEEVDHFVYLQQHLDKLGFSGLFCPKPDSPCLYEEGNVGPDGCAMFWRESQFKLLDHDKVVLMDDHKCETNQVALICKFLSLSGPMEGKEFVCAATHLKSKRGYEELRYQQGKYLERILGEKAAGLPVIVCGDFNADPHEKVVNVMKQSKVGLTSAYTFLSADGSEPPYTTWKVRSGKKNQGQIEACHTIDYVFFSTKDFRCVRLLKFPTAEDMGPGYLPSYSYPSDHLSLVVDFKFLSV